MEKGEESRCCHICRHQFEENEVRKKERERINKIAEFFGWAPFKNLSNPELSEEEPPDFLNDFSLLFNSLSNKTGKLFLSFEVNEGKVYCRGRYHHGDEGCTCDNCRLSFNGVSGVNGNLAGAFANALSDGVLDLIDNMENVK